MLNLLMRSPLSLLIRNKFSCMIQMNRVIDLGILLRIDFQSVTRSRTWQLALKKRKPIAFCDDLNKDRSLYNSLNKEYKVQKPTDPRISLWQNNKYEAIHLPGEADCVLTIRLRNNIHRSAFCILTSTKRFPSELTSRSKLNFGHRSSNNYGKK